jgi:phosphonate transport system substrate-binding protein
MELIMITKVSTVFISLVLATSVYAKDVLTFGIVPQQSAKVLAKLWTPICVYLSEKTGVEVMFTTAKDIPTFERRVLAGTYDIAYMNPYHFTVFNQKPGYRAIAKQKNKKIKGILVVPKDSSITHLSELNQQTLAFPSPAAFAASVIPRAKMRSEGINITPKYVSSHDSVYLSVSKGFFPAGGGIMRTYNNTSPEVKAKLKVLWTTPGYTPHAIAIRPNLDQTVADKIQQALIDMNKDEEGRKLLLSVKFNPLEIAKSSDWDDVRGLDIQLLEHLLD